MRKKYFYEFSGTIFLEAYNKSEAEKAVTGKFLNDYLIDERVFEVDEYYVAHDLKKREDQLGTYFHPLNDSDDFEEYKIRKCRYHHIFKEFLHGKFDKDELIKRMDEAEANDEKLDDCDLFAEISMVDLEGKKLKTVKHCFVN